MHPFKRRSSHLSSEFPTFSTEPTDIQLLPPLAWKRPSVTAAALVLCPAANFLFSISLPPLPVTSSDLAHSALKSPLYECPTAFLPSLTFLWTRCLCTQKPKCWLFPGLCIEHLLSTHCLWLISPFPRVLSARLTPGTLLKLRHLSRPRICSSVTCPASLTWMSDKLK